jgi:plastocyanin
MITRRSALVCGGAVLAALLIPPGRVTASEVIGISMMGNAGGSHVWFDPVGIHVMPGQTLRWTNRDPGNSHTVTAYHPTLFQRPRRIPSEAAPWDSDYLLPAESFEIPLSVEGVYDYYCVPHEHAGMVGRIVVGRPDNSEPFEASGDGLEALPEVALANLPSVDRILAEGQVTSR